MQTIGPVVCLVSIARRYDGKAAELLGVGANISIHAKQWNITETGILADVVWCFLNCLRRLDGDIKARYNSKVDHRAVWIIRKGNSWNKYDERMEGNGDRRIDKQ